jgi:hypothetical protein
VLPNAREIDEFKVNKLDVIVLRELDNFFRVHNRILQVVLVSDYKEWRQVNCVAAPIASLLSQKFVAIISAPLNE